MMIYDESEERYKDVTPDEHKMTGGVFSCPECGKKQHAYIIGGEGLEVRLKCKYCGHKWTHTMLTDGQRRRNKQATQRRYYLKNKDRINSYCRAYHKEHKDRYNELGHKYARQKRELKLASPDYVRPITSPRAVAVCDKVTMEVLRVYSQAKYATTYEGVPEENIKQACLRNLMTKGKVVYRYADSVDPNESFAGKRYRPINVIDTVTEEMTVFYDVNDIANTLYVSPSNVYMSARNGYIVADRYKIEYAR